MFQHPNHRGTRRRRARTKNWKLIWTNNEGEPSQSGEGNRIPESPGGSEIPKEVGPKEAHTKAHPNYIYPRLKRRRILKAAREKKRVTYKGVPIRQSADFSKETLQARRDWKEVIKVMKGKDLPPRWLYPAKLPFRMEGQIECFPDKGKLKEFIITKSLLHEMLKGLI